MNIQPKITPVLDPGFVPAVLGNQAFEAKAAADPASHQVDIALTRKDGTCFRWSGKLLPHTGENVALNETYVERIVKFLLWQKGGNIIPVSYTHLDVYKRQASAPACTRERSSFPIHTTG